MESVIYYYEQRVRLLRPIALYSYTLLFFGHSFSAGLAMTGAGFSIFIKQAAGAKVQSTLRH
jgi:hypothetical protein